MTVAAALHAAVAGAEDQVAVPAAAAVAGRQLHSGVHQHQAAVAADSVVAGLDQAQALVLWQVACYLLLIPQHYPMTLMSLVHLGDHSPGQTCPCW